MPGESFALPDVQALVRDLAGTNVLSVYLETRVTDPSMRDAWRTTLSNALRDVEASVSEEELPEFERARGALEEATRGVGGMWSAEAWVAFATASGVLRTVDVPTHSPTFVAWRRGPVIMPYMRVLKELRPVYVALVELHAVRIFRYAWGELEELPGEELSASEHPAAGEAPGPERPGQSVPAPRSATGTERGQRREEAAFESLSAALAHNLAELAGEEGWILVGGTREWARVAANALPDRLAGRVLVSDTLGHQSSAAEIMAEARVAASTLRAARGQAVLDSLLQDAGAPGQAARGVPAVQRALQQHAVDVLLLSPSFMQGEASVAEDAVRATLLQGGDVEVLSGGAAERLDSATDGVMAKLRFTVE